MTSIFNIQFEPIAYCEYTHKFINYPKEECEFILVTSNNEFIHCISIYTLEDTFGGQQELLTIQPYNEYNDDDILFENCKYIAYIPKIED